MPSIERLDRFDVSGTQQWDRFVMACPDATFFHRAGWQNVLKDVFRHETWFLMARGADGVEGVLPLARI